MRGDRPEGRLLHPRRRQPHRGAVGGADPHPAPAGVGQRPLPAPEAGSARRPARRARARPRPKRRDVVPTPRRAGARAGAAHGADAGAGRACAGRASPRRSRRSPPSRSPGRRPCPWWWRSRWPGWCCSARPGGSAIAAGGARLLLRGVRPGSYPRGGSVHVRLWAATRLAELSGATGVASASWTTRYARALGAKIGEDVDLHSAPPVTGLLKIGRGAAVEPEVDLGGYWVDGDVVRIGKIRIGAGATVGVAQHAAAGRADRQGRRDRRGLDGRAAPYPPASAGRARPRGGRASGVALAVDRDRRARAPGRSPTASPSMLLGLLPAVAALPALAILAAGVARHGVPAAATVGALLWSPLATLAYLVTLRALVRGRRAPARHRHGRGLPPGAQPRWAWQVWATERLMGMARTGLFPLYASQFTAAWLRLLGADVGRGVEASTVIALPKMTTVADGAFLADDTMVGTYELGRRLDARGAVARRQAGVPRQLRDDRAGPLGARTAASSACSPRRRARRRRARRGSACRRCRCAGRSSAATPAAPSTRRGRLKVARAADRAVPGGAGDVLRRARRARHRHADGDPGRRRVRGGRAARRPAAARGRRSSAAGVDDGDEVAARRAGSGPWSTRCGARSCGATSWPTRSSRCWPCRGWSGRRAAPRCSRRGCGRMGASIGRGVWLETYWLPESDLVRLGDGATVNRGCVVQTHLFHDRIMSMDAVRIDEGATLGPNGIILPGREHRRGDHRRAGLAGHPRRRRARGEPLAGQPDHDVELSREADGRSAARSRRPVPACARQRRLPRRALRPGHRLQARGEPAHRAGRAHRRRGRAAEPVQPRPRRLSTCRGWSSTAVRRRFKQSRGKLHVTPARPVAGRFTVEVRYGGKAVPVASRWGDVGLGRADRRRARREPARRRAVLVPVQRPPLGQGDLPHRRHHRSALHRRRHRCAHRAAPLGRHDGRGCTSGESPPRRTW